MRRRTVLLASLLAAVALGVLVASAAALSPPAGTPDLSQMVIQPADLGAGAPPVIDAYVKAPASFSAEYHRTFRGAQTTDGVPLLDLDIQVLLGNSERSSHLSFVQQKRAFHSKLGRRVIARDLKGNTSNKVRFGRFRTLRIGVEAFLQPVTVKTSRGTDAVDFLVVRVGSVLGDVGIVTTRPKGSAAVATTLGGDVASHITAVLGATGPTGATGTTGATG